MPDVGSADAGSLPDFASAGIRTLRIALMGNPNTGKTTLFNRLCGLRHKTSNFPGTTQEARLGFLRTRSGDALIELIDLPGIYSLELDQPEPILCRAVLSGELAPTGQTARAPDAVAIVVDATNLSRNLVLVGETLRRRLPTVVIVNMVDLACRSGLVFDAERMSSAIGCEVILCSARTGEGVNLIQPALERARIANHTPPGSCEGVEAWADEVYAASAKGSPAAERESLTDRLDRAFTHPLLGALLFVAVMAGLFWVIFKLATVPMDLIDLVFARLSAGVHAALSEGFIRDLLADGIITGVGATLIFLPQICLLFFLISLLEDTGYLARAAFVMDRLLRPFGLPGHAFVPLLSSHACALPGIMSARAVPDRRDRLATILVAPFMSCSARLPVYVLLITLLFRDRPALGGVAFVGCYALGASAGLLSAMMIRRTILRGRSRPLALELPSYKIPSLRTALLTTLDRGVFFVRKAGSVILAICIVLWWLQSYPQTDPPAEAVELREQAESVAASEPNAADELLLRAEHIENSAATANSFAGRIGRTAEPIFRPLGYDWQLTIGVMTSFAAREVFVSTMSVILAGDPEAEEESVLEAVAQARRGDGSPVFTRATSWSLLIYYVLAMQCLPTLAVTAREAGGWKWAGLQLVWMSGIAYLAALLVYQLMRVSGIG